MFVSIIYYMSQSINYIFYGIILFTKSFVNATRVSDRRAETLPVLMYRRLRRDVRI